MGAVNHLPVRRAHTEVEVRQWGGSSKPRPTEPECSGGRQDAPEITGGERFIRGMCALLCLQCTLSTQPDEAVYVKLCALWRPHTSILSMSSKV